MRRSCLLRHSDNRREEESSNVLHWMFRVAQHDEKNWPRDDARGDSVESRGDNAFAVMPTSVPASVVLDTTDPGTWAGVTVKRAGVTMLKPG